MLSERISMVPGFRLSKTDGSFPRLFRTLVLAHVRTKKRAPTLRRGLSSTNGGILSALAFRAAAAASQQAQPTEEHGEGAGLGDGGEGENACRAIKGSGISRVNEIDR